MWHGSVDGALYSASEKSSLSASHLFFLFTVLNTIFYLHLGSSETGYVPAFENFEIQVCNILFGIDVPYTNCGRRTE